MQPPRALPALTDRLALGTSGLAVSPICLGLVDDPKTVPAAFEAGINFFFVTTDMHWPVYEGLRRGLRMLLDGNPAARDSIVIAGVSYATQPEFCSVPFEELLAELSLEKLDVAIAGGSYGREIGERLEVYRQHRAQRFLGIRAIGSSFHDRVAARGQLEQGDLDIAFVRFNPVHAGASRDLFPHAGGRRALLFNFKSTVGHIEREAEYAALGIGDDYWRPHVTDYYRFALTEPALDGLLVAMPAPHMIAELADALARGPLVDDDRQYLLDLGELVLGRAKVAP